MSVWVSAGVVGGASIVSSTFVESSLGFWPLELGSWPLELGSWSLELGSWLLELGSLGSWLWFLLLFPCCHGPQKDSHKEMLK